MKRRRRPSLSFPLPTIPRTLSNSSLLPSLPVTQRCLWGGGGGGIVFAIYALKFSLTQVICSCEFGCAFRRDFTSYGRFSARDRSQQPVLVDKCLLHVPLTVSHLHKVEKFTIESPRNQIKLSQQKAHENDPLSKQAS